MPSSDMAMTDVTPEAPVTEAGKRMYNRERIHNVVQRTKADDKHDAAWLGDILAIEAEAVARDREALGTAKAEAREEGYGVGYEHGLAAALAATPSPAPTDREAEALLRALDDLVEAVAELDWENAGLSDEQAAAWHRARDLRDSDDAGLRASPAPTAPLDVEP